MTPCDAVIVGAGIQGATIALELARRGVRASVLERAVPGRGTTAHSLGIVHGGLRYLQRLDVMRYRRSSREQTWFLDELSDFVRPLACVMPLYRGRFRSKSLFAAAFLLERMLDGPPAHAPRRMLLGSAEVAPGYPIVREGLVGAACWHDAVLCDPQRAVEALLERAKQQGTTTLSHTEATGLVVHDGRVVGVHVRVADGAEIELRAPVVIVCAGPQTRAIARHFDRDCPGLSAAVLAFNLVMDLPAPASFALALSPTPGSGRSYFLRSHADGLLAGTWYAPWRDGAPPEVPAALVEQALSDLRRCLPGADCRPERVRAVLAGVLPSRSGSATALRERDVLIDHGRAGGVQGLYSVLGVKLTTARALAQRAAEMVVRSSTYARHQAARSPVCDARSD